jgi:hypothetical protein
MSAQNEQAMEGAPDASVPVRAGRRFGDEEIRSILQRGGAGQGVGSVVLFAALFFVLTACQPASPSEAQAREQVPAQEAIPVADFAALVERISEPGGYFDTDNLISNESGYLNVVRALRGRGTTGGAYIGVGPDQNFSYIAAVRPEIAFITDIRRDNMLHHLLLKALLERSETRVEFLALLHGVAPPAEPGAWREASVERIVAWVDSAWTGRGPDHEGWLVNLREELLASIAAYGVPLAEDDLETIERFHSAFVRSGLGLRFTSFGRAPRAYYPTYRQLVLETDVAGDRASYLATREAYAVVRALQLANRIIPVVGDLAGATAIREIGTVMREMDLELSAFYTSNVEYYLWRDRTFQGWVDNVQSLPSADDAVVIRSYFPSFGREHPSAVLGYHATQSLQPVATLAAGDFAGYWEVVTRDALPLR